MPSGQRYHFIRVFKALCHSVVVSEWREKEVEKLVSSPTCKNEIGNSGRSWAFRSLLCVLCSYRPPASSELLKIEKLLLCGGAECFWKLGHANLQSLQLSHAGIFCSWVRTTAAEGMLSAHPFLPFCQSLTSKTNRDYLWRCLRWWFK